MLHRFAIFKTDQLFDSLYDDQTDARKGLTVVAVSEKSELTGSFCQLLLIYCGKTMPYKIVQTIERGETCLTVIPSGWEENGILHWPKKNAVAKLSLEEFSRPSPKWERINCVKKREFKTRAEAESELEKMECVSDTEADDTSHPPPSKKVCPETSQTGNTIKDFNDLFLIPGQEDGTVGTAPIDDTDELQNDDTDEHQNQV